MRTLTARETLAADQLRQFVGDHAYLNPTGNGLTKAIMDATKPLRSFLAAAGFHDYETQPQGDQAKRVEVCRVLSEGRVIETQVSLYRPITKSGDPRIWISGLREWADADDMLAVFVLEDALCVLNLSNHDLGTLSHLPIDTAGRADLDLLQHIKNQRNSSAVELRLKLGRIAGLWIPAVGSGDTAVGRTIETAMGISMNSSTMPDFRGIELKTKRTKLKGSKNRTTLFSQVPDWKRSPCSGSLELLNRFGYKRDGIDRLYCQIDYGQHNSQGLVLELDARIDALLVLAEPPTTTAGGSRNPGLAPVFKSGGANAQDETACLWDLEKLRMRLREKHAETFWIDVDARTDSNGNEEFRLRRATHTKSPFVNRFEELVRRRIITVDFLIKRLASGSAKDKGYLFKLKPDNLSELFPEPDQYSF